MPAVDRSGLPWAEIVAPVSVLPGNQRGTNKSKFPASARAPRPSSPQRATESRISALVDTIRPLPASLKRPKSGHLRGTGAALLNPHVQVTRQIPTHMNASDRVTLRL